MGRMEMGLTCVQTAASPSTHVYTGGPAETQGWATPPQGHTGTCTCQSRQLMSLLPPNTHTHIPLEQHRLNHHHRLRSQRPAPPAPPPAFPVMGRVGGVPLTVLRGEASLGCALHPAHPARLPSRHSKAGRCWRCGPLCWSSCQCWTPPSQTWAPPRGGAGCCWGLCASWARTSV